MPAGPSSMPTIGRLPGAEMLHRRSGCPCEGTGRIGGGPDGNFTAHGASPNLVGQSMKERKDPTGKVYGEELYKIAQEGKFSQASYMIAKPGETTPVPKESYITKIGDQVCGVGYYK